MRHRAGVQSQVERRYQRSPQTTQRLFVRLYLEGLATGGFEPVFRELVGETTALSANAVVRLKEQWANEYEAWRRRPLREHQYAYIWAAGIYLGVGLEKERTALLCVLGAREDGEKELVAMEPGYTGSAESWAGVLRDLRGRGLQAPLLAIGDGAPGLWAALDEVFPTTEHQRCWNHRVFDAQAKLPKGPQPEAWKRLWEMARAETQAACGELRDRYVADLRAADQHSAAETVLQAWEELLTFYHYPKEHWIHLRTTNPLESIFGGIRGRTDATEGLPRRDNALYLVFKIVERLSGHWRTLNGGANLMALVLAGSTFKDGLLQRRGLRQLAPVAADGPQGGKAISITSDKGSRARGRMHDWLLARWRRRRVPKSLLLLLGLVLLLGVGAAAFFQFTGSRSGGGLKINLGVPPSTLDPQRADSAPAETIIKQCLQGLLGYDEKLVLSPGVAQSFTVSPDGLDYTFLINDRARWQDGRRVTAQDFQYAFQRLFAPDSPFAGLYLAIKGADQYRAMASQGSLPSPEVLGVQAIGDRTLHITLERPVNHFLHLLTLSPTYPVRRDIIEQYGDKWARPKTYPCNGPFVLREWTPDRIVLERNKKYRGERPRLGRIQAFFVEAHIGPAEKEYQGYKDGDLDIIDVIFAPGAGTPQERKEWQRRPNAHTAGILFNTQSPPFDNVKVRQAVATALNRDRFLNENLGGTGKAALSWIPPQFPEHQPSLGQEYRFDLSRAKDILRDAGYPSGQGLPALAFQHEDNRTGQIVGRFVAEALSGLGITVELEPMKPADLQRALKDKRFTFTFFSRAMDIYHVAGWFVPYFKSDGPFNYSGYNSPRLDQLIQQAEGTRDPLEELRLWRQVHQQVVADVPIAPFFHEERTFLAKSYVKGLVVTPLDGAAPGDSFFSQVRLGR